MKQSKLKQIDPWERSRIKEVAQINRAIDQDTLYAHGFKDYKRLCPNGCANHRLKCSECFNFEKFKYFRDHKGKIINE